MSKSVNEWFKHQAAGRLLESWTNAAIELLIAVGLVLLVVGTPFSFLAGAIYLNSLVGPRTCRTLDSSMARKVGPPIQTDGCSIAPEISEASWT